MTGFLCATDWQENVTMTSGLGSRQTTSQTGLDKHEKHRSGPETSWKPRGYKSREESGRALGETIASIVVMQRQKGPERSCCVLQERDGSLTGGRQWECPCQWLQYVEWFLTPLWGLSILLCLVLLE